MGYALVGSVGAVVQSSSGGSITTLAWGSGETRAANNLLVCFVAVDGSATAPAAPSGWSAMVATPPAGTTCTAQIFYKIATGSDAAPTIAAVSGAVVSAQLAEFSHGVTTTPVDQTGTATDTTATLTPSVTGIRVRDGGRCRFVGCAFALDDIHHIKWWEKGGLTDIENGMGLCRRHHRLLHGGFSVDGDPNAEMRFLRPDGSYIGSTYPVTRSVVEPTEPELAGKA